MYYYFTRLLQSLFSHRVFQMIVVALFFPLYNSYRESLSTTVAMETRKRNGESLRGNA